jgi:hypothetical protein
MIKNGRNILKRNLMGFWLPVTRSKKLFWILYYMKWCFNNADLQRSFWGNDTPS